MGLQLPDWVRTMFLVVTGDGWPEADEDELRALACAWTELGDAIYTLEHRITDPVRGVRRTDWDGPAAEAFSAAGNAFVGQDGRQLAGLSAGSRELSTYIYGTAVNVQYMKLIVIGELLILAAQIAYLIAMGPWTFGATAAAVPALQAAGRSVALAAVRQLAISMTAGQALQVGMDAAAQLTQLDIGTRKHWDTTLTGFAAITGVVGGVLGPGLGVLANTAARAIQPVVGKTLAASVKDVVGNATQEYATSVGTGLVTRQGWVGTPWDLTAGATEGALDAIGRSNRGLRGPDAPTPTGLPPDTYISRVESSDGAPTTSGDTSTSDLARRAQPYTDAHRSIRVPQPPIGVTADVVELESRPDEIVSALPDQPIVDTLRGGGEDGGDGGDGDGDGDGDSWSASAASSARSTVDDDHQQGDAAAQWSALRHRLDLPDAQLRQIVRLIRRIGGASESRALETAGIYADLYGQRGSRPRFAGARHSIHDTGSIIYPRRLTELRRVMELVHRRFPELAGQPGPLSVDHLLPVLRRSIDPAAQAVTPERVEQLAAGMRQLRHGGPRILAGLSTHGVTTRRLWHNDAPSIRELQRHFLGTSKPKPAAPWGTASAPISEIEEASEAAASETLAPEVSVHRVQDPGDRHLSDGSNSARSDLSLPAQRRVAAIDDVDRWRQVQSDMGLGDADVRRIAKWIKRASTLNAFGLALQTAHLYREFYGNPGGRLQLSRAANGLDANVTVVDPKKLADLRRLLDLTRRTFPPPANGWLTPLSSDGLLPLIRQVLDPNAETVTRARLDRLIRGVHEVRRGWRSVVMRTRRSNGAGGRLLGTQSVTAHELERHFRRVALRADGVDGAVSRSAELGHLQVVLAEPRPQANQPYEFGVEDLKQLVAARRAYHADPRRRGFSSIEDYAPIARDLLGVASVDLVTIASLADLVHRVRSHGTARERTVTTSGLARALIERDWSDRVRPSAPVVTPDPGQGDAGQGDPGQGVAPTSDAAGVVHNMAVPGLLRPREIPLVDELTTWLNRIVPGSQWAIDRESVVDALTRSFGSALDEGIRFTAPERGDRPHRSGDTTGLTYVVNLYARAVGSPAPGVAEQLPQGASLTLEQRNAAVESSLTRHQERGYGAHLDVGVVHRMEPGIAQYGILATAGYGRETHQTNSAGFATERKVMFKPRGPAVVLDLPVSWSARVWETTTGRWHDFVWERSETAGDYHVPICSGASTAGHRSQSSGRIQQHRATAVGDEPRSGAGGGSGPVASRTSHRDRRARILVLGPGDRAVLK